ncbi:hypothetical protein PIB30_081784 [Stylosanthes scabra]|uniref:Uncharacterized protein n=1 Tax=Stylosanthes scabra TaxID=79078 RepID=A0ABU6VQA6_9FABA|nr:hypothetical protein [Stylosanthes scabra]
MAYHIHQLYPFEAHSPPILPDMEAAPQAFGTSKPCIDMFRRPRLHGPGFRKVKDLHKSIIESPKNSNRKWVQPYAYHRFCFCHIASNFNNKFGNLELKKHPIEY